MIIPNININVNLIGALFLMLCSILQFCHTIRFNIQPHTKRCLTHEMYPNQLAVGEYEVPNVAGQIIDMKITDSQGHVALNRDKVSGKGKFAVTSEKSDFYDLCFTYSADPTSNHQSEAIEIYVDYRVGADAKKYEAIDHDKMSQLEQDLNKINDLTNSIIVDFAYLKKREKEMRDTNASTNNRLFYQTITSVVILLVLTTWQILYLRTFFKARKLID